MILAAEAEAAGSSITWVQIVGLASIVVAAATYLASQRDRRRIHAAAVYVVVDHFATYYHQPSEHTGEMVAHVHNGGDLPIQEVSLLLHNFGRRRRLWRFRKESEAWTGEKVGARVYHCVTPHDDGELAEFPAIESWPGTGFIAPVVVWFTDGQGRRWVRWPDGRLSRVWWTVRPERTRGRRAAGR